VLEAPEPASERKIRHVQHGFFTIEHNLLQNGWKQNTLKTATSLSLGELEKALEILAYRLVFPQHFPSCFFLYSSVLKATFCRR